MTNTSPRYRMIGTTDDVVNCQRCGKPDLRMTVVLEMLDADGNGEGVTYYGTTCASRALATRGVKRTTADLRNEATAAERQRRWTRTHAEEMVEFYAIPADGDLSADRWEETVDLFRRHNPSTSGPRSRAWAEQALGEAIVRWRAALTA